MFGKGDRNLYAAWQDAKMAIGRFYRYDAEAMAAHAFARAKRTRQRDVKERIL